MRRWLIFLALLSITPSLHARPVDDAKNLYEKAVAAFEQDDYLKALDLLGRSLKLAPDNKQAQKLKLVIEDTLRGETGGEGANGDSNSRWTFCYGQNSIENEPAFIRVFHSADSSISIPAYATMALQLPPRITEYEVLFSLKFGAAGDLPSGVALLTGSKPILNIEQNGELRTFKVHDATAAKRRVDERWHEFSISWRDGIVTFKCDGAEIAHAPCKEVPDLLQFGGFEGKPGHQQEAFFKWTGLNYNVAS